MFVCATVSPRIRIDNGYSVYNYHGQMLYNINLSRQLFDIVWKYKDVGITEILEPENPVMVEKKAFRAHGTPNYSEKFKQL